MPVDFHHGKMAALCDSGSSINIMSHTLYQTLSVQEKSVLSHEDSCTVGVANNQKVNVFGIASIKLKLPTGSETIEVYVLEQTSHSLILGLPFIESLGLKLDFSKHQIEVTKVKGRLQTGVTIPPNTESVIWVTLPESIFPGIQGICTAGKNIAHTDLLVAKTFVTVSANYTVPVKVMNPTNAPIVLKRNFPVAEFQSVQGPYQIIRPFADHSDVKAESVNNAQLDRNVSQKGMSNESTSSDFSTFISKFDVSQSDLSSEQRAQLFQLLYQNKHLFVTDDNPSLGLTHLVEHKIHLKPDAQFKHQRPYRLTPDKRKVLRHQLDELLQQGIIAPVTDQEDLPITSPVVLVTKHKQPSGLEPGTREASLAQFRFICDFRHLNSQTKDFHYTIPDLQELTECLGENQPRFFSLIDIKSAFFTMPISQESQHLTAFNTCFGTYKFLRLPQGLKTAPQSFQMLMDKVFKGLTFRSTACYMDDVAIMSPSWSRHLVDIQEVFTRLAQAGLKLGPSKCLFGQSKCVFLGHEISAQGIGPPPDRVKAIADYPTPTNLKAVRRLWGLLNWFRKYIPNLSVIGKPITKLLSTQAVFEWGQEQDKAFQDIKTLLINSPLNFT